MTRIAIIRSRWMISRFTLRDDIIVTTDTGANHLVVIQRRNERRPVGGRHAMARFAVVGGIGMIAGLALRNHVIVATEAGTNHLIVIQWRYKG
jgi:hypothetical protein